MGIRIDSTQTRSSTFKAVLKNQLCSNVVSQQQQPIHEIIKIQKKKKINTSECRCRHKTGKGLGNLDDS